MNAFPVLTENIRVIMQIHDVCLHGTEDGRGYINDVVSWETDARSLIMREKQRKSARLREIKENQRKNFEILTKVANIIFEIAVAVNIEDPSEEYDTIFLCDKIAEMH